MTAYEQADPREDLIRTARDLVASVGESVCPLVGACIVSSLAAGDFTSVSDVDILMVAADKEGRPGTFRRLIGDRVFEWMVLSVSDLPDVEAILCHAGLCHDIVTAIILLDADGGLEQIQQEVAFRYQSPEWVWKRTLGQLDRAAASVGQMRKRVTDGDILGAQRAHVSALKSLFAVPRAVLNRRCTMTRGLRSAARQPRNSAGWGTRRRPSLRSARTHGGRQWLNCGRLPGGSSVRPNWETRRRRPGGGSCAAPIGFWKTRSSLTLCGLCISWSSATVEGSGGQRNGRVWEPWLEFTNVIGICEAQQLLAKADEAEELHGLASALARECLPATGCGGSSGGSV